MFGYKEPSERQLESILEEECSESILPIALYVEPAIVERMECS